MKEDIVKSLTKRKGYPKKFGTGNPGSDVFKSLMPNDCFDKAVSDKKTIWELPMLSSGTYWVDGPSSPGPYR